MDFGPVKTRGAKPGLKAQQSAANLSATRGSLSKPSAMLGTQRRRPGDITAAYTRARAVDFAGGQRAGPLKINAGHTAGLYVRPEAIGNLVARPCYVIGAHVVDDITAALLFPSPHILKCDIGSHVNVTAVAAPLTVKVCMHPAAHFAVSGFTVCDYISGPWAISTFARHW